MMETSMNQKKELKKITKQVYPLSQYPFFEGRYYRKNLFNEMSAYWGNHPESSSEEIKNLFCGEVSDVEATSIDISKKAMVCFIILGILILICVALYIFSSSWEPPIITTN